ncbi:MAG TPA: diaminopimelate epimerase [Streptosporangiaceae bacterium]|jgi:diaminopimelate epimerase
MRFAKGHGTENDFVILPDLDDRLELTGRLVTRLCDRHAGLGADGVLRVVRAAGPAGAGGADAPAWFMDYRNADGSVAEMCGNGIRVFGRYLLDHGLVDGGEFTVATRAGNRRLRAAADGTITVDMGPPLVLGPGRGELGGVAVDGLSVSLGNPHLACVVSGPLDGFDLSRPPVLDSGQFPDGANVELLRFNGERHIEMRVHERGSGPTRSCGTGAVAAAVAAKEAATGRRVAAAAPDSTWVVDLPGGRLRVRLDGQTSFLSGPAVVVAEGDIAESWLAGDTVTAPGVHSPAAAQSSPAA